MNKIFCVKCGNKIEFVHAAPNFCGSCGHDLSSLNTSKASESSSRPPRTSEGVSSRRGKKFGGSRGGGGLIDLSSVNDNPRGSMSGADCDYDFDDVENIIDSLEEEEESFAKVRPAGLGDVGDVSKIRIGGNFSEKKEGDE